VRFGDVNEGDKAKGRRESRKKKDFEQMKLKVFCFDVKF